MFQSCIPWLSAACGVVFCCSSVAEDVPDEPSEEPALSVSLEGWKTEQASRKSSSSGENGFLLSLKLREESSWKVGWCEEDGVRMTLVDSEASSASGMKFSYFSLREYKPDTRIGTLSVSAESWVPSPEAKWVEAKGTAPFVMFRDSRMSESVRLKLVQGSSVPLLLEGSGMDGEDVQAELSVDEYREESEGKHLSWTVFKLKAPSRVGIQKLDVLDKDGLAMKVDRRGDVDESSGQGYEWSSHMIVGQRKGDELILSLTYMARFRKMTVPVNVRFGLFGTVEKKNNP